MVNDEVHAFFQLNLKVGDLNDHFPYLNHLKVNTLLNCGYADVTWFSNQCHTFVVERVRADKSQLVFSLKGAVIWTKDMSFLLPRLLMTKYSSKSYNFYP